jgi:uncharacterized protein (DUF736 family)
MVIAVSSVMGSRPTRPRLADQARGTARASIAFPQQLTPAFFPYRQAAAFLAHDKKAGFRRPPLRCGPEGCGPIAPRAKDRHRGCDGRGPSNRQTEMTMATIGTFTALDNGYTGSIKTLTLNIKAKFAASEKDNDKAPDYRIFAGATEFGAAWKKTVRDSDREYLSVKLDDPSFPAPIYASLVKVEGEEGFSLIWSRRSGD